jgi:hypothetical protein
MVPLGKQVDLARLGITVSVECKKDNSLNAKPIIFIHRTPADSAHLDITLKGLEEILRYSKISYQ